MKKLFLASHNPDVTSKRSSALLTLIEGGQSQKSVPTGRFLAEGFSTNVRSAFNGPNGQAIQLVEMAGFLMVKKLVEFGLGQNEVEWEVKEILPDSKENQAKLMVTFSKLVQELCLEGMNASA